MGGRSHHQHSALANVQDETIEQNTPVYAVGKTLFAKLGIMFSPLSFEILTGDMQPVAVDTDSVIHNCLYCRVLIRAEVAKTDLCEEGVYPHLMAANFVIFQT